MNLTSTNIWRRVAHGLTLALVVAATLLPTGCVRRRLAVRSNPPGALVFVDNQQIGTTPCSVDFTYYGTREIRLVKPGFETLTVNQPIPTPWYQIPPLDFVSENLVPSKIQDHRTVAFNLEPQVIVPTEQLLERANQLRQETEQGVPAPIIQAAPAPSFAPQPVTTPTPLPPVTPSAPPPGYSSPALSPSVPSTALPGTSAPSTATPTYPPPPNSYAPPTATPGAAAPATSPFSAPTLPPVAAPGNTQQGPPIVSPPLR